MTTTPNLSWSENMIPPNLIKVLKVRHFVPEMAPTRRLHQVGCPGLQGLDVRNGVSPIPTDHQLFPGWNRLEEG